MSVPEKSLAEIEGAASRIKAVLSDLRDESMSGRRVPIRAERDAEICLLMLMRLMTSVTEAIEDGTTR